MYIAWKVSLFGVFLVRIFWFYCYMPEILILIFFYVPDYYKIGDYKYDIFTEKNSKFLFYRFNDFLGRWKA